MLSLSINSLAPSPFPWFYKSGFCALFFITLGGIYNRYEETIDKYKIIWGVLILFYIACIVYDMEKQVFHYVTMTVDFNIAGILVSILGIATIVQICKRFPVMKLFEYIGKNSIVFYFFSGVLPAAIGMIFQFMFEDKKYVITLAVALLSVFIGFLLTYVIVNFLPWMTDFRKLKKYEQS